MTVDSVDPHIRMESCNLRRRDLRRQEKDDFFSILIFIEGKREKLERRKSKGRRNERKTKKERERERR